VSEFARYEPKRTPKAGSSRTETANVRPAEVRDCETLAEILTRREGQGDVAGRRSWFESQVDGPEGLLLVAEVAEKVVGYGRVTRHPGSEGCPPGWYLAGLVVSPAFRRQGVGRQLTTRRVEWVAERAPEVFYFANERNGATIHLHADLGFREVTRDFTFPGVTFQGGRGILFRADLQPAGGEVDRENRGRP
jgi:ribosomal protein S18 acetylase RimI-like enzyme